jgi:hypothetical protein
MANAGTLNVQVVNPSPGGSSSALPFTVSAPTFSIVTSPTQPSIAGISQSAPVPLTVVPTGGFIRNVTLSLQPNAANVTGSFTATSIAPNNPGGVRYAVPVGTTPGTYHVAIQGDDGEGDDNSQDGDVVVQDVDVIVLDITPYFADFLAVLDDGTVFPYFEVFVDGSDADLVTNQVYQARYQPPNGPVSAFQSGVDSIGSTPSTTSFSAFSLPQSGFGQYTFWMTQVMTVDYGGQYLFAAQLSTFYNYPQPAISSISPNSMQLGAVANVTFSGTGLGTPDQGLDIYGGILSISICYGTNPPTNNNCATATNLTGQLSQPQPFLGAEAPNATNTLAAATLNATSANTNTGTYQVSLNVFGSPTNWLSFAVGDSAPNITAITDAAGNLNPTLAAGTPSSISLLGTGFGDQGSQSSVGICPTGANPCTPLPLCPSSVFCGTVASWSNTLIDLLVTPPAGSQGTYDVLLTSGGVTGNGFLNSGGDNAQSNRQQVNVAPPPAPNVPYISSIAWTPSPALVGSTGVKVTLSGTNFGTSPQVNLPTGVTSTGQISSDSVITVTVNIDVNAATIGGPPYVYEAGAFAGNLVTVTANGQASNKVELDLDGPNYMIVQSDTIGPMRGFPSWQSRFVTYQIMNFSGKKSGWIPVAEDILVTPTIPLCGQPIPPTSSVHCDGSDENINGVHSNGQFTDEWGLLTGLTPAGCGESVTDHWQWCAPPGAFSYLPVPNPGKTFGTLIGSSNTGSATINGYTNPPNPMPLGTVISQYGTTTPPPQN